MRKRFICPRLSFLLPYKRMQLVPCCGGTFQKTISKGNKKMEGEEGCHYPGSALALAQSQQQLPALWGEGKVKTFL